MLHQKPLNYTKEGSKIAPELQSHHETQRKQKKNDTLKSDYINNIKGKWIKQYNQNTQIVRVDQKQEPNLFCLCIIHNMQKVEGT